MLRGGLHVAVLSAFAGTQPLLDLLGRNATFFVARRSERVDIIVLALLLAVVAPLVAAALVCLSGLVGRRAWRATLLVAVAVLVALIALPFTAREVPGATRALAVSLVAGGFAAVLYARTRAVPMLLGMLGPAPVVFLLVFFLGTPVRGVLAGDEAVAQEAVPVTAPLLWVVFDELPVQTLLTADGRIDAQRFPSFARVAGDGYWFRNATTQHPLTDYAVPAMLSGRKPDLDALPTPADHPHTLFTLFAKSHEERVLEAVTHLCPSTICEEAAGGSFLRRMRSLLKDVAVAYLHRITPATWERTLPPLSNTWDMPKQELTPSERAAQRFAGGVKRRGQIDEGLPRAVAAADGALAQPTTTRPRLNYAHFLLPHQPWTFTRSGHAYTSSEHPEGLEGHVALTTGFWRGDDAITLGLQRHLHQLAYADTVLGKLLSRLDAAGDYERTMIVLTSDHGAAFVNNETLRQMTPQTAPHISRTLFVAKPPGTRPRGIVSDAQAQTMDVLPTVADLLDFTLPWRVDGRSALRAGPGEPAPTTTLSGSRDQLELPQGPPVGLPLTALVARTFPRRSDRFDLHAFGPYAGLVGKRAPAAAAPAAGSVRLDHPPPYTVDPTSFVLPLRLTGAATLAGGATRADVVAVVDGTVVATGLVLSTPDGLRLTVLLPEHVFADGHVDVALYAVSGPPSAPVLAPVPR